MLPRKSTSKSEEAPLPRPAYETYYAKKAGRDHYGEQMFAQRLAWFMGALFFGLRIAFVRTGDWVVDLAMAAFTGLYTGAAALGIGRLLAWFGVRTIRGAVWTVVVVSAVFGAAQRSNVNWSALGMTVEKAQQEAVRRHPQLGVPESALNREFVARYRQYQVTNPEYFRSNDWPIVLADECEARLRGGAP